MSSFGDTFSSQSKTGDGAGGWSLSVTVVSWLDVVHGMTVGYWCRRDEEGLYVEGEGWGSWSCGELVWGRAGQGETMLLLSALWRAGVLPDQHHRSPSGTDMTLAPQDPLLGDPGCWQLYQLLIIA